MERVRALAEEFGFDSDVGDPSRLADRLVETELLTRWQADRLLAGRHRGFVLGPYVLRDLLGKGGMGTVYLAEHRMMRRRVAIKILHGKRVVQGSTVLERFHHEARAVAQLDHHNIVRAFDLNRERQADLDVHYLVMEYVDGETVSDRVRREGRLDVVEAADIVRQVADGLAHAHRRGLVHRDVKPPNVMVDVDGVVKLLDLGLALLAEQRSGDSSLNAAGSDVVLGTADFISPEQVVDSDAVDHRSDIYSLGCLFFYALVGRPPFHEGSLTQRLRAHESERLPSIANLRPEVPVEIARIVERMTAKRPADRYQSMDEVARDLFDWLVVNGGPTWRERALELGDPGTTLTLERADSETVVERRRPPLSATDVPLPMESDLALSARPVTREGTEVADETPGRLREVWVPVMAVVFVVAALLGWATLREPAARRAGNVEPIVAVSADGGHLHLASDGTSSHPTQRLADPIDTWAVERQRLRADEDALLYLSFDVPPTDGTYRNEAARSPLRDLPIVVVGEPTVVEGRRPGSTALRFGGPSTEDRLVVGPDDPTTFELETDLSFVIWFRTAREFEVQHQCLLSKGDNGYRIQRKFESHNAMFAINDHHARPGQRGSTLPVDVETHAPEQPVDDGEWHMVVGVADRRDDGTTELRIYVDGELGGSNISEHHQQPNGAVLMIGANQRFLAGSNRRSFEGDIDDVLILNRALDAAVVADLYESTRP